jgi:hypothetical protein
LKHFLGVRSMCHAKVGRQRMPWKHMVEINKNTAHSKQVHFFVFFCVALQGMVFMSSAVWCVLMTSTNIENLLWTPWFDFRFRLWVLMSQNPSLIKYRKTKCDATNRSNWW